MDCERARALFSTRLDGELGEEAPELESHLEGCSHCGAEARVLDEQDRDLRRALASTRKDANALVERVRVRLPAFAPLLPAPARPTLLIVDDEAYILRTLGQLLAGDFEVHVASSADGAEAILKQQPIDLVLCDQRMPRRTGVQLLEWVREHYPRTVRLLMTGYAQLEDAVEAINRGQVYHYIPKPWRTEELLAVLRNAADKLHLERNLERLLEQLRLLNHDLEDRVTQRTRQLQEANAQLMQRTRELERLALTDPLTGLLNRRAMEELTGFEIKRRARYSGSLTLGLVDVDHFRRVNSLFHHTGGDEVLRTVANVLSASVRQTDSVGRVGGEEFLVLARETNEEGAAHLAERMRSTVEKTEFQHQGRAIPITVSIGCAVVEDDQAADNKQMYALAAAALNQAKKTGRNRYVIYNLRQPPAESGM